MKSKLVNPNLPMMDLLVQTYGNRFKTQEELLNFLEHQKRSVDLTLQLVRNAEQSAKHSSSPTLAAFRNASKPTHKKNKTTLPGIGLDLSVMGLFVVLGLANLFA